MRVLIEWLKSWKPVSLRTALVVVFVLYTLAGFFLVPWFAKKVIVDTARERMGREVTVEEVRCNPFELSLTVRGFAMPDRPGSTMVAFDELYANAQVSSLFRWALTLKELRIERPFFALRRFEDGAVNVLELKRDIEARTAPEKNAENDDALVRALLHHIQITDAGIDVDDLALTEPLHIKLGPARFELHGISTIPERRGDHDFVIGLPRGGEVRITGNVVVEPLGIDGTMTYNGLFLEHTWPEIRELFNFDLVSGDAEGSLDYAAALDEAGLSARIENLQCRINNVVLEMREDGTRVLEVPAIAVTGGKVLWPEAVIGAAEVKVEGATARTWIEPDGTLGVLELMPRSAEEQVLEKAREVEAKMHWTLDVKRFELSGASAEVEDRTLDTPQLVTVSDAALVLTDILTEEGARWGVEASALIAGSGRGTARGEVSAMPAFADLEVGIEGLELGDLGGHIEQLVPIELREGTVRSAGRLRFAPDEEQPDVIFEGNFAIDRIDLVETVVGSQLLEWGLVEADGIRATAAPTSLRVAKVEIHGAGIDVVVSPEGKINLLELMLVMAERADAAGGGAQMPPIRVDELRLHDCTGAYIDQTLEPEFRLALEKVNGAITAISSEATAGAQIDIEGRVAGGGLVDVEGEIDVFDPGRITDIALDCREVQLPPLSPMAVRFTGHPFVTGAATLDLDYDIAARQLTGTNVLVTDGLKLGDKVEGEGLMNLPFKLGVSLLTDKNGLITLEFPIEGSLDDPGFGVGNAIQAAVKEVVGELVKSPFRLLAKLGGGSGDEDLGAVDFEAGGADLKTAIDKLRTLAAGALERPALVLQIEGAWDDEADSAAIREAAFETLVAERLAANGAAVEEMELTASLELLEALYLENTTGEQLAALRAQYTTVPPEGEEAPPVLDETAYYRDLRGALIDAQPVDPAVVQALGPARAEVIRAFLVDEAGLASSQVQILDAVALEPSGDGWVRCRLDVGAGQ